MCRSCWTMNDSPYDYSREAEEAAAAIRFLYEFTSCGGAMHIVTDDCNLDDDDIKWCLANLAEFSDGAEEAAVAASVGLSLLRLTETGRWSALALAFGWR